MPESLRPKHYNPGSGGIKTRKLNIVGVVLRARRMCIRCCPRWCLEEHGLVRPREGWGTQRNDVFQSASTAHKPYQPFFLEKRLLSRAKTFETLNCTYSRSRSSWLSFCISRRSSSFRSNSSNPRARPRSLSAWSKGLLSGGTYLCNAN